MFLPTLDWASWGCRCATRPQASRSSSSCAPKSCWCLKNKKTWDMILLLREHRTFDFCIESPPRNRFFLLKSAGNYLHDSIGNLWIQSLQFSWVLCRIWILKSPILPYQMPKQLLPTIRWPVEDELILLSLLCGKRLSKNLILTLAAKVQIRMSLLLSFLRYFHR